MTTVDDIQFGEHFMNSELMENLFVFVKMKRVGTPMMLKEC